MISGFSSFSRAESSRASVCRLRQEEEHSEETSIREPDHDPRRRTPAQVQRCEPPNQPGNGESDELPESEDPDHGGSLVQEEDIRHNLRPKGFGRRKEEGRKDAGGHKFAKMRRDRSPDREAGCT